MIRKIKSTFSFAYLSFFLIAFGMIRCSEYGQPPVYLEGVISVYGGTLDGNPYSFVFDYRYGAFSGIHLFKTSLASNGEQPHERINDFQGSFILADNGRLKMTFHQSVIAGLKDRTIYGWNMPGHFLFLNPIPELSVLEKGLTAHVQGEYCPGFHHFGEEPPSEFGHRWVDISRAGLTGSGPISGEANFAPEPLEYFGNTIRGSILDYLDAQSIPWEWNRLFSDSYFANFRLTIAGWNEDGELNDSGRVISTVCSATGMFGLQTSAENVASAGDNGQDLHQIPDDQWLQLTGSVTESKYDNHTMAIMRAGQPPTNKLFFTKEEYGFASFATGMYYRFRKDVNLEVEPLIFQVLTQGLIGDSDGYTINAYGTVDERCKSLVELSEDDVLFTMNVNGAEEPGLFNGTIQWQSGTGPDAGIVPFYGQMQRIDADDLISYTSEYFFNEPDGLAIAAAGRHSDGSGFIIYMGTTLCRPGGVF